MKTLAIIRHAKSSWDDPHLADFDRPLNDRGQRDAPLMAAILKSRELLPDRMLSSPARRARETAAYLADGIGYPAGDVDFHPQIYLAEAETLVEAVRSLHDGWNTVFLVGHNPGLTDAANRLADADISNIPTTGIAVIEFPLESWSHILPGAGRLVRFDYPKRHR